MKKNRLFPLLLLFILLFNLVSSTYAKVIYVSQIDDVYTDPSRPYTDLFLSQRHTGPQSDNNCGPTSLNMVMDWLGIIHGSVAETRSHLTNTYGYVYTDQITSYLDYLNVLFTLQYISTIQSLTALLDQGIVLLCIDISLISISSDKKSYIDREFASGKGHFIIATGYYQTPNNLYIQVLDPLNTNIRYYDAHELLTSITSWYSYGFLFKQAVF